MTGASGVHAISQKGFFEDGFKMEGPRMRQDIVVGDASCYGCPVACGKRSQVNL
jgi:aldehyde:ferredoxin oxidoreductase